MLLLCYNSVLAAVQSWALLFCYITFVRLSNRMSSLDALLKCSISRNAYEAIMVKTSTALKGKSALFSTEAASATSSVQRAAMVFETDYTLLFIEFVSDATKVKHFKHSKQDRNFISLFAPAGNETMTWSVLTVLCREENYQKLSIVWSYLHC